MTTMTTAAKTKASDTGVLVSARLSDPHKVAESEAQLRDCQHKVSTVLTRLYAKPEHGGHPFLFAISASKNHELATELPGLGIPFTTAATDGRKYYWNPVFLSKLTVDQATVVMLHESFHVIFFHFSRMVSLANKQVVNWAMDYVVNSAIMKDHTDLGRKGALFGTEAEPGELGAPLKLQDLLDAIDGKKPFPSHRVCFADESLYGRDPVSIYREIMDHYEKSPNKCPTCGGLSKKGKGQGQGQQGQGQQPGQGQGQGQGKGQQPGQGSGQGQGDCNGGCQPGQGQGGGWSCKCPDCGGMPALDSMDAHVASTVSKEDVIADLMKARNTVKAMGRGKMPSAAEEMLTELDKPVLKFTDIVRSSCQKKVRDAGRNNDWTRLRRRFLVTEPMMVLPQRHTHKANVLVMLDTSGSMGAKDMSYGLGQLKCLGETEVTIVPCDAKPYWEAAVKIEKAADMKPQDVKIKGRGGTVFEEFFRDFEKELGRRRMDASRPDCIVILTDGDCGTINPRLKPRSDVVWVLTRDHQSFNPTFGRVCPLRHERM